MESALTQKLVRDLTGLPLRRPAMGNPSFPRVKWTLLRWDALSGCGRRVVMELLRRLFSSGERRNAVLALRESEARFREQAQLLDLAQVGIFLRDLNGAI